MKLTLLAAILATAVTASAEIAVKSGETFAFLGDSITQGGWGNPRGYVRLVVAGLEANGVTVKPVPAGISGHKSNQMLSRLDKDVLEKKPQWMTLSCGVNDVWHGAKGVPLDQYQKNITEIVDKAAAAGVKVVILTSTPITENKEADNNVKGALYNDALRAIAKEKKLPVADLSTLFWDHLKTNGQPGKNVVTSDGVHMNAEGNKLMARGVLTALGAGEAEMKKAEAKWAEIK